MAEIRGAPRFAEIRRDLPRFAETSALLTPPVLYLRRRILPAARPACGRAPADAARRALLRLAAGPAPPLPRQGPDAAPDGAGAAERRVAGEREPLPCMTSMTHTEKCSREDHGMGSRVREVEALDRAEPHSALDHPRGLRLLQRLHHRGLRQCERLAKLSEDCATDRPPRRIAHLDNTAHSLLAIGLTSVLTSSLLHTTQWQSASRCALAPPVCASSPPVQLSPRRRPHAHQPSAPSDWAERQNSW